MISGARDQVLALACLRHGLPAVQGRGVDGLPPEAIAALAAGLVRSLDLAELRRAFAVVNDALLDEAERVDPGLARRLTAPVRELSSAVAGAQPLTKEAPPRAAPPRRPTPGGASAER